MLKLTYKHQQGRVWKETFPESILAIPRASQNNVAKLIRKNLLNFEHLKKEESSKVRNPN